MKKGKIFVILSIIFISFMVLFYGGRFIYFYIDSREVETFGDSLFVNTIKSKTYDKMIKKIDENYYYTGNSLNNYVYYSNHYFRILGVVDGKTVLVDDISTVTDYESVDAFLKKYVGNFKNVENYFERLDSCLENCGVDYARLLTEDELTKTNNNGSYLFENNYYWLNNGKYAFNGEIKDNNGGMYGVKAVLTLKSDTKYYGGSGTKFDPYFVTEEDSKEFFDSNKSLTLGSYIKYSDLVWKVVDIDDKLKLVSTTSIGKHSFGSFDVEDENSIIYYLNHDFYDTLDKEYLKEGNFPVVGFGDHDSLTLNVGLLTIGDLYLNDINDSFIFTRNDANNSVFKVINGRLYEDSYKSENEIYPVIYLDKDVKLEGMGTETSPFVVSKWKRDIL